MPRPNPHRRDRRTLREHRMANGREQRPEPALYLTPVEAQASQALMHQIQTLSSRTQIDPMIRRINRSELSPTIKDILIRGLMSHVRGMR